ncbi:MAG: ABC transporter ATP-binding protein [Caldithrix sp.]|nr:MAG: ABC transporter ATP-binding protein [Caldithrix sp.]
MIQVSNLTKSYGAQVLFEDVSFSLNKGERVGLVGRNGHGKTTLFRLILGVETPDSGATSIPKNYRISYLQQHLDFTKATVLEEACLGLPPGQEHDAWRAEKVLAGLGFSSENVNRPAAEFSGGFQVRLNLAKALVSDPDLLLLDEPTNYLDIVSIRWLTRFLRAWKSELMLITHDRSFMDSVTTHTLGIHRRSLRKIQGGTEKLYNQIASEEEIYEKTRVNDEKRRKEVEQFIRRFRAKARLAGMVQSRIKTLEKQRRNDKLERIDTLEFSFRSSPFNAKMLMDARNVSFAYDGQPELFERLNLTVAPGDRICIMGKNGKGKTTLMKVLAGALAVKSGEINTHPALKIGYFEQTNTAGLAPNHTVEQEIMLAEAGCTQQEARNIAGAMMFSGDDALKKISVLSGGEKSRVLLGKLLVSPAHLMLLDEPTNHLDMESCDSLMAAIDSFDGAVVLITHNEMFLHMLATRLVVFDRGKQFVYEGGYQDFLNDVGWESDEENGKSSQKNEVDEESSPAAVTDKKALRKLKAQFVQEKSRVLRPLASRMETLETEIEKLEARVSEVTQALVAASTNGDGAAIAGLAKTQGELERLVNASYNELDEVTQAFEAQSKTFEEKLKTLV